ncbi:SUF system NifU family Fe-S cluster assembly protein [Candidatus Woesearchaeota archaeon]|jgi:nitrogen fixation NifU-like protein|nr:SUF system NifU family Fe-S cluster assembly protein [Candidatus Woesearchaeota archaeon]
MDEAREMYQEHILENYKDPMNFGTIDNPTNEKRELNPLCGDDITIRLIINENKVKEIKFTGRGCAISMASASLLTEQVKGKTIKEILKLSQENIMELLMISISPGRMKCATLSLKALQEAVG